MTRNLVIGLNKDISHMATVGKNKRRQLTVFDDIHNVELSVDSTEEIDFVNWCCEATSLSVINDF